MLTRFSHLLKKIWVVLCFASCYGVAMVFWLVATVLLCVCLFTWCCLLTQNKRVHLPVYMIFWSILCLVLDYSLFLLFSSLWALCMNNINSFASCFHNDSSTFRPMPYCTVMHGCVTTQCIQAVIYVRKHLTTCLSVWNTPWNPVEHQGVDTTRSQPRSNRFLLGLILLWPNLNKQDKMDS